MEYQTRHMVAQREFGHGDRLLQRGDKFECAEIDADYYQRHDMARPADAAAALPAAAETAAAQSAPLPRRGRRPAAVAAEQPSEGQTASAEPASSGNETSPITAADAGAQ